MSEQEIKENHAYEWGFGKNLAGELGFGVKKNAIVPAFAIGLRDLSTKQIASSSNYCMLLTSAGHVYFSGQRKNKKQSIFRQIPNLEQVRQVVCSDYSTLCLLENRSLI